MPNNSPRFKEMTFAAVGSEDVYFQRPSGRSQSIQFVGSGNFEASIFGTNDPNYTAAHFVDVTSALFGSATITGATANGSYFFTMYDATNSRMGVGIVTASNGTNTVIEAGDAVVLVGSANMSGIDYVNLTASQLAFDFPQ